jgi:hypothetical protein
LTSITIGVERWIDLGSRTEGMEGILMATDLTSQDALGVLFAMLKHGTEFEPA